MELIIYLIAFVEFTILGYLGAIFLYHIIFSIAGIFYSRNYYNYIPEKYNRILVLVPGFKEDAVIYSVAEGLLNQKYPADRFKVCIIADSFLPETIQKLKQLPIIVKEVSFTTSTKAKSLKKAVADIPQSEYDIAIILDADNILEENFLFKINDKFNEGYKAIQGRRVAKNRNTSFAILDGISEHINNHLHRKGPSALGLSAYVIGSGMAFDFALFKKVISTNNAIGGFDRELQLNIVENNVKINYLHDAIIYDEKVDNPNTFTNQRRRWISSQLFYLRRNFSKGIKNFILNRDFTYFRFAVLSNILLPNSIYFICLVGIFLTSITLQEYLVLPSMTWGFMLLFSVIAFLIAIPRQFFRLENLRAMFNLPIALFLMVKAMFKVKGANKKFIHTPHTHVEIQK